MQESLVTKLKVITYLSIVIFLVFGAAHLCMFNSNAKVERTVELMKENNSNEVRDAFVRLTAHFLNESESRRSIGYTGQQLKDLEHYRDVQTVLQVFDKGCVLIANDLLTEDVSRDVFLNEFIAFEKVLSLMQSDRFAVSRKALLSAIDKLNK